MTSTTVLDTVKKVGTNWANELRDGKVKQTCPGSLSWLLWGPEVSKQSIVIKMGKTGEEIAKEMIRVKGHDLLECGVQLVSEIGKKKDIDLVWIDVNPPKRLYVRELKGNIELDTEKLPATYKKMTEFKDWYKSKYPDYQIDVGILNWSIYERSDLVNAGVNHIKRCESEGIHVDHFGDFCKLIDFDWEKDDFYSYFREIGSICRPTIPTTNEATEIETLREENRQLRDGVVTAVHVLAALQKT
jgi:hypothetical protein